MQIGDIENLRRRADDVNRKISERKANLKVLKEQLAKKLQQLKDMGILSVDAAKVKIQEHEKSIKVLTQSVEKEIESAEHKLQQSEDSVL